MAYQRYILMLTFCSDQSPSFKQGNTHCNGNLVCMIFVETLPELDPWNNMYLLLQLVAYVTNNINYYAKCWL